MNIFNHVKGLIDINYFKAPPKADINPHRTRRGVERIELVLKGAVMFESCDGDKERRCGSLFWHVEGDDTIHRNLPQTPYECMVFSFKVEPGIKRITPRMSFWASPEQAIDFSWDTFHMVNAANVNKLVACSYVYSTLYWQAMKGGPESAKNAPPEALPFILEYIEHNINNDIQLSDLTKAGKISEPYLYKIFRKNFNTSPYKYVLARKMRQASILLKTTSYQVKLISRECGIENVESFCRSFKKHYGISPLEYRNKDRQEI